MRTRQAGKENALGLALLTLYRFPTTLLYSTNNYRFTHTRTHTCTHTGSRGVHLEMSASNTRALKFYLKFGFSVQEFDSDDEAGEPPEDTLIMARTL